MALERDVCMEEKENMWQTFTPEEVGKQYSPSQWVTRIKPEDSVPDHINTISKASTLSREQVQYNRIVYGPGDEQKIDLFGTDTLPKDAPILVYVHGGYWQALSLDMSAHLAANFHKSGVVVASIGYDLCPNVSFEELVEQNKKAVVEVMKIAHDRGSRGVYITGHSAGGHLAAFLLATDWSEYGVDSSIIKGGAPISGIFDIRPICRTPDNDPLKLNERSAWHFSPRRMIDNFKKSCSNRKIDVIVGDKDSPEYIRQSEDFVKVLSNQGLDVSFHKLVDTDHFQASEQLENASSVVSKILCDSQTERKTKILKDLIGVA